MHNIYIYIYVCVCVCVYANINYIPLIVVFNAGMYRPSYRPLRELGGSTKGSRRGSLS